MYSVFQVEFLLWLYLIKIENLIRDKHNCIRLKCFENYSWHSKQWKTLNGKCAAYSYFINILKSYLPVMTLKITVLGGWGQFRVILNFTRSKRASKQASK